MKKPAFTFLSALFLTLTTVTGWAQPGGNGFPMDCDCDTEIFEPVCAQMEMDGIIEIVVLPNACLAECMGFTVVDGDCELEDFPGDGDFPYDDENPWGDMDCDCDPNEFEPVCVDDGMGNIMPFPSACIAECVGLTVVEGDCEFPDFPGDGDFPWDNENPWGDVDCDCDPNEFEPVCVDDGMGNIMPFPSACIAECIGLTVVEGDCEFPDFPGDGDFPWDNENPWGDVDCDCDPSDFSPVCVEDEEGNIFSFPSACVAECLGLTVVEGDCDFGDYPGEGDCPWDIENPWEDLECDCDPEVFEPVCVDDGEGNILPFPSACLAECLGLTVVEGDCEFPDFPGEGDFPWDNEDPFGEDCGCDDTFDPVCVILEEGIIIEFVNACYAECFGLEVVDCDPFNGGGENEAPEFDWQDYDLPGAFIHNDQINTNSVAVYPNPISSEMNLKIETLAEMPVLVEVLDMSGKLVMSEQFTSVHGYQFLNFNLEGLENGIYMVRMIPTEGDPVIEKVLKQ